MKKIVKMIVKRRSVALATLTLAVTLGAGVTMAAATAKVPALSHNTAATQHTHMGNSGPASSAHPMNHGFFVSQAAHTCHHGTHAVHGTCVRQVAQSAKGKK